MVFISWFYAYILCIMQFPIYWFLPCDYAITCEMISGVFCMLPVPRNIPQYFRMLPLSENFFSGMYVLQNKKTGTVSCKEISQSFSCNIYQLHCRTPVLILPSIRSFIQPSHIQILTTTIRIHKQSLFHKYKASISCYIIKLFRQVVNYSLEI